MDFDSLSTTTLFWIPLNKPGVVILFVPIALFLTLFIGVSSSNIFIPVLYLICLSILYLDICCYLYFFSGKEPLMLAGVDLRKTQNIFKTILIIQSIVWFFATVKLMFGFNLHSFDRMIYLFIFMASVIFGYKTSRFLAFSKFSLEFALSFPKEKKLSFEKFGSEISHILLRKIGD